MYQVMVMIRWYTNEKQSLRSSLRFRQAIYLYDSAQQVQPYNLLICPIRSIIDIFCKDIDFLIHLQILFLFLQQMP
jgi:hypothetical protein